MNNKNIKIFHEDFIEMKTQKKLCSEKKIEEGEDINSKIVTENEENTFVSEEFSNQSGNKII